jgi:hypothetical protein
MNSVTSYTRWMNRLLIQRINFIFQGLLNNNDDNYYQRYLLYYHY